MPRSRPRLLSCLHCRCCWLKAPIPVRSSLAEWASSRPARSPALLGRLRNVVVIAREVSARCVWITRLTAAANRNANDCSLVLRQGRFRSAHYEVRPGHTVSLSRPSSQVEDLTSLRTKGTPRIVLPCRRLVTLRTADRLEVRRGQGVYLLSGVVSLTLALSCRKPQITLR
jgi:hypothetical protein